MVKFTEYIFKWDVGLAHKKLYRIVRASDYSPAIALSVEMIKLSCQFGYKVPI